MEGVSQEIALVESLSYGRAGIVRAAGRVVFIEGVAPGDRIRFDVLRDHGRWAEGRLMELIEPGASRVEPPCPLASTCGGCPWQQVDYETQLEAKRRAVIDAIERVGGFADPPVEPIVRSPVTLGYRNRLKLRYQDGKLGFYRAATHSLVAIDDCPVAEDVVRAALEPARRLASALATRVTRVEIVARGLLPGVVLALNSAGRLRAADRERIKEFLAAGDHDITGVLMWGRGWKRSWGDTRRRTATAFGVTVESAGSAFGQVNSGANASLVELALEAMDPRSSDAVLELYAGAGNFTLPLATRATSVTAVEFDTDAVEAGRTAAAYHGLSGVRFIRERVERFVAGGITGASAILVNPPRSGLGKSAEPIALSRGVERVVYVSCNPATLARDLRVFASNGYRLDRVVPVDMFPHTFHVETVCRLTC